jgi:hypothetical protein
MKKETAEQKEYWDILERIVVGVHAWGLVMIYYIPKLKETGISEEDIKENFLDLLEAYAGEEIYNGEKVGGNNLNSV